MNPDVNKLLETASADVREVDLAERAWAGGRRRRSRRTALVSAAAAAVVIVGVAVGTQGLGTRNTAPPANPAPSISQTKAAWKTAPDGTQYVVAPPLGAESTLLQAGPSDLPPSVDPTAARRELTEVFRDGDTKPNPLVAAVFLEAVGGVDYTKAIAFQPVFVLEDGSLVQTGLKLDWVRDSTGNRAVPLSADSAVFATWAAFPQPGKVVVIDLRTGKVKTVPVPSTSLERVRWNGTRTLVASGDEGAWSIDMSSARPTPVKAPRGYIGADESITVDPSKGTTLTSWKLDGLRRTVTAVKAPVSTSMGQTMSTNLTAAISVSLDNVGGAPATQGILAVSLADPTATRLLVLGDTPERQKGCCQVVGFQGPDSVLYSTKTDEGLWLLAWNLKRGDVGRTLLIEANPAVPPVVSWGFNLG